ncbi:MAG TPA: class I SAM-dependent methyltransferase [Acidobacteriota bacterium]|nr:class I SAM-dependent methyltransferase [Acidobacteriota bacterium]HNU00251.1 class I SAM-dependent methyltransferase [Acidobacteriota bacterium]HPB29579.1 class I SAM-dependent methyltransferase [Acidobacteriota bacterium]HQO27216.1 class I SAM-dependent methyltransferase [Acidobacteriota bacterium]HQP75528.1 class I SAM-dependent methyltransferase [Acidobacteriota bacterium]
MDGYYDEKLAAERLRRCYELAPPRVRQYLEAEIHHVLNHLSHDCHVLELGCGFGRVLAALVPAAALAVGVDTSRASLAAARRDLATHPNLRLLAMDAATLGFRDGAFDTVVAIQNGISAFHRDPAALLREACRVVHPGGTVLFSSYADAFWEHRLDWFRRQAAAGLVGAIDEARTGNGIIVCTDGFTATTFSPADFLKLTAGLPATVRIVEVDGSSLFCELSIETN